jgi:hypothetical protein
MMRIRGKEFHTFILIIMLAFLFSWKVSAQLIPQVAVGVSEGDYFKYNVVYIWKSTDPGDTAPAYWVEGNSTEFYQTMMDRIAGTAITINTLWRFLNGTEILGEEFVDVSTGLGGSPAVYAANLSAGDQLYPFSSDMPWSIDATEKRSYGAAERETNHVQATISGDEGEIYRYLDVYFDKATGALVETTLSTVFSESPDQTFTRVLNLKETNAWDMSGANDGNGGNNEDNTPGSGLIEVISIISIVVFAVIVVSVLIVRSRKRKRKR